MDWRVCEATSGVRLAYERGLREEGWCLHLGVEVKNKGLHPKLKASVMLDKEDRHQLCIH